MSKETLDFIDSLYSECIKDFPQADRESFVAGADAVIMYMAKNNKI